MPTSSGAFAADRGHLATDVGMTKKSALITRKQLNPYEEAKAVRAMLDRGLTEDRRRSGAGLAEGPRHRAREGARAARRRRRLPGRRQRLGGRPAYARAGLGARCRSEPQRQRQGLRGLSALGER